MGNKAKAFFIIALVVAVLVTGFGVYKLVDKSNGDRDSEITTEGKSEQTDATSGEGTTVIADSSETDTKTTDADVTTEGATTVKDTTEKDETTVVDVTTKENVTTKEETTTKEKTTTAESTTKASSTTQKTEDPLNVSKLTLKTGNAQITLKVENDGITVTSLKTNNGTEYISTPTVLSLPSVGETFSFDNVVKYTGERTTKGLKFIFKSKSYTLDYYVVSSESYSGPFEFYAYLTNKSTSSKKVSNGSYFDMNVKFSSTPTASTFAKESGIAEGWTIYSGTRFNGTGIYKTKLGKTSSSTSSEGSSAKFSPNGVGYTALYFWTGLKDTEEYTITFYAKGTKGQTIMFDYEPAHANVEGNWIPMVDYGCGSTYTFTKDNEWELVTLKAKSAYPAGCKDGTLWNQDHADRGFPFRIYTTDSTMSSFWIDEVTIGGQTQHFNGSSPTDDWSPSSFLPNGGGPVVIDNSTGYATSQSTQTQGYAKATAFYSTHQNWNAGGDISMMYLDTGSQGLYFAQEWSNGKLTAQGASGNNVFLNAIIGSGNFSTTLSAGQKMLFPSIYVGVYDGDIEVGSNLYKRWFLHEKAPENMASNKKEPLTQEDMQMGYTVSQYGIQSIKWDYGWWSDEVVNNPWRSHEGLLEVHNSAYLGVLGTNNKASTETIMNKFKSFVKNANSNANGNVKVAMYILLKDTEIAGQAGIPTSVGQYAHPEWFSNVCITGVGDSADLGNEECVKFYQQYLGNFFKTYGVTTWRSDFEPITRESDQANRHAAYGSDVQYWCTVGFSELVDYLIDNVDGFRYESCSSGGSMKDLFTMTKASVINCDDSADYMSLHMSFYDSSYCIHPAQLQLPINSMTYMKGTQYYTGSADYMYGLRTQITGGVMLSNWQGPNSVSGYVETTAWKTVIANTYNQHIKPLIRNGDLYHILGRPDGANWDGLEYILPTQKSGEEVGVIMLWKPAGASATKTIKLRGLEANAKYVLTYTDHTSQNCTKTGKELMNGLSVVFNSSKEAESDIIFITKK